MDFIVALAASSSLSVTIAMFIFDTYDKYAVIQVHILYFIDLYENLCFIILAIMQIIVQFSSPVTYCGRAVF